MEFKDRVVSRMRALNLNATDLSRLTEVSKATVSFWVNGTNGAKGKNLLALARALQCTPEWLSDGIVRDLPSTLPNTQLSGLSYSPSVDVNVEPVLGPVRYYEYPEISWVQAGKPVEAMDPSNVAACEIHPSDAWAGEQGFWLKVNGSSMTSQGGISFIEGMVILVAPGFDVEPGNYVVAKLVDTDEATFKQYVRDSGRTFLKPLNPAFPTVEVDNTWVIVGKVVDAKWPRAVLG